MRKFYEAEIRSSAKSLHAAGKTYKEIGQVLGIPKSTLSLWLGKRVDGVFDEQAQREHLRRARILSALAKRRTVTDRLERIRTETREELERYPVASAGFYRALLAMLYWAEGSKHKNVSGLRFVNTDPVLVQFYMALLRACFPIDEKRFHIRIHLHAYHDRIKCQKFWSDLLHIPKEQFGKIYVKKRSASKKFRENFMGICFINYKDSRVREKILALAYELPKVLQRTHLRP